MLPFIVHNDVVLIIFFSDGISMFVLEHVLIMIYPSRMLSMSFNCCCAFCVLSVVVHAIKTRVVFVHPYFSDFF